MIAFIYVMAIVNAILGIITKNAVNVTVSVLIWIIADDMRRK